MKKLAIIEEEIEIVNQHEVEIVSKRVSDEKSYIEKIIAERDDQFNDLVHKTNKMEIKIDTLEKMIEDLILKRRYMFLKKGDLDQSFLTFVKWNLKQFPKMIRHEKDAYIRATGAFECNICNTHYCFF